MNRRINTLAHRFLLPGGLNSRISTPEPVGGGRRGKPRTLKTLCAPGYLGVNTGSNQRSQAAKTLLGLHVRVASARTLDGEAVPVVSFFLLLRQCWGLVCGEAAQRPGAAGRAPGEPAV